MAASRKGRSDKILERRIFLTNCWRAGDVRGAGCKNTMSVVEEGWCGRLCYASSWKPETGKGGGEGKGGRDRGQTGALELLYVLLVGGRGEVALRRDV